MKSQTTLKNKTRRTSKNSNVEYPHLIKTKGKTPSKKNDTWNAKKAFKKELEGKIFRRTYKTGSLQNNRRTFKSNITTKRATAPTKLNTKKSLELFPLESCDNINVLKTHKLNGGSFGSILKLEGLNISVLVKKMFKSINPERKKEVIKISKTLNLFPSQSDVKKIGLLPECVNKFYKDTEGNEYFFMRLLDPLLNQPFLGINRFIVPLLKQTEKLKKGKIITGDIKYDNIIWDSKNNKACFIDPDGFFFKDKNPGIVVTIHMLPPFLPQLINGQNQLDIFNAPSYLKKDQHIYKKYDLYKLAIYQVMVSYLEYIIRFNSNDKINLLNSGLPLWKFDEAIAYLMDRGMIDRTVSYGNKLDKFCQELSRYFTNALLNKDLEDYNNEHQLKDKEIYDIFLSIFHKILEVNDESVSISNIIKKIKKIHKISNNTKSVNSKTSKRINTRSRKNKQKNPRRTLFNM